VGFYRCLPILFGGFWGTDVDLRLVSGKLLDFVVLSAGKLRDLTRFLPKTLQNGDLNDKVSHKLDFGSKKKR